jgi:hypothetical protein
MKLSGGFFPARRPAKRRRANPTSTATSVNQASCDSANRSYQAAITVKTGAAAATDSCQREGGSVSVKRGIAVNRNPTAKQIMKPWI